ncbi:MAG: hypothetical protein GWP08_07645 [Nitrospiraceae bacterium]|nr:hypothetical protein [Nitrospiraceae bacterium]
MTTSLDKDLHAALSGEMTPKFLATLDGEGCPNCVPVISLTPYGKGELIFAEFFMNKSRRNLLMDARVSVAVLNESFEGWSLKGRFTGFETTGERVEYLNTQPLFRYNAYTSIRAAGSIIIEEASARIRLSKARLLLDFAKVRAVAAMSGPGRSARRCMPRQVAAKFRRLSAVRAAAFVDSDGYPRAFPVMGCVANGTERLILGDGLFEAYAGAIPAGARMAVSIITTEPVAYQVKGTYARRRGGIGSVDVDACYSASPPLLGKRLDV